MTNNLVGRGLKIKALIHWRMKTPIKKKLSQCLLFFRPKKTAITSMNVAAISKKSRVVIVSGEKKVSVYKFTHSR